MKKDLVQIIKDNPGCIAEIDNDAWYLYRPKPPEVLAAWGEWTDEQRDNWTDQSALANYREVERIGSGYGSGNCYGGDILQALAIIVGIKVKSV